MKPASRRSLALLAVIAALPLPAAGQGWFNDRFDNASVNADTITARFRAELREEMGRLYRRPPGVAEPSAPEREAARRIQPWWTQPVAQPIEPGQNPLRVSLAFLYDSALVNSAQVRVFADLPAIRETGMAEVAGRYVPRAYGEGRADSINGPTRSTAVTFGEPRLVQRERGIEFGVRQRLQTGAEVTVGQRFWSVRTNSTDYLPRQQSTSRTFLTVVQPLLRDSGVVYARSLHEIARLDANTGLSEFRRQTESHLAEVARAYWALHLLRSSYLQKKRLFDATQPLVGMLGERREIDTDEAMLARVRAAQARREAELLRARAAIRNGEARLRGLTNDPRFEEMRIGELIPADSPLATYRNVSMEDTLVNAISFRPEVQQLFAQHRASVLREGMAQVDALPRFDAIGEINTGGRAGYGDLSGAWNDGRRYSNQPGGVFGFRLEVPLGTDDAQARLPRRRLETRQVENQSRATMASIVAEAEVTLNEYRVAFRELSAGNLAMQAAQTDLRVQTERWRQGLGAAAGQPERPGVVGAAGAYALDRLLDAQERLAAAEDALATAQSIFTVAAIQLERVRGTFTALERIDYARAEDTPRGTTYNARRTAPPAAPNR